MVEVDEVVEEEVTMVVDQQGATSGQVVAALQSPPVQQPPV